MPNYILTLNNGKKMPLVGHGLWKIPNEKTADHVYTAIKAGYRLLMELVVSQIPIIQTGHADLI
jgi:hypothetical protein